MDQFPVYHLYIRNNKAAMETIEKCKSSETFKNIFVQVRVQYLCLVLLKTGWPGLRLPQENISRTSFLILQDITLLSTQEIATYESKTCLNNLKSSFSYHKNRLNILVFNCHFHLKF